MHQLTYSVSLRSIGTKTILILEILSIECFHALDRRQIMFMFFLFLFFYNTIKDCIFFAFQNTTLDHKEESLKCCKNYKSKNITWFINFPHKFLVFFSRCINQLYILPCQNPNTCLVLLLPIINDYDSYLIWNYKELIGNQLHVIQSFMDYPSLIKS